MRSKINVNYEHRPFIYCKTKREMEAVRKAASEAVDTIRNSPLFRRKFGNRPSSPGQPETPQPLHPETDTTPFVQGVYFQVIIYSS